MRVRGTQSLLKKLARYGAEANNKIQLITMVAAQEIATDAASNAPVDTGKLKQSINAKPKSRFVWKVSVNVPYAAYIEFGTGTFVEIPPEWESIAVKYYKSGKGYISPQPYLYPAYKEGVKRYKDDLQDLLNNLTRRFNS